MPLPTAQITDRRIQKTQGLLRGALVSLIGEKPYDSIAVKEILDRANVGRSTFYTHFRDKDELLVSGIHDVIGAIHLAPQSGDKKHIAVLWFSLPIFEYHYQHRHAGGDRIGARGRAILHEHLRKVLANFIAEVVKKDSRAGGKLSRQIPADLLSEYIASTFVLVLNWWLDKKMPTPPKGINDLFHRLISPTLPAVWE
jgi:AcrR family transcriptional regulator